MSTFTSALAATRWRLSLGRLKRGGAMAFVTVCKLVLLFSMFESASHELESDRETLELQMVETANSLERRVAASRTMLTKSLTVRCLRRALGLAGGSVERALRGSRIGGHRLPNGLCAPMQC